MSKKMDNLAKVFVVITTIIILGVLFWGFYTIPSRRIEEGLDRRGRLVNLNQVVYFAAVEARTRDDKRYCGVEVGYGRSSFEIFYETCAKRDAQINTWQNAMKERRK